MTWKTINIGDPGKHNKFGGDDIDKISKYFSGALDIDTVDINSITSFRNSKLQIQAADNPDGSGFITHYIFASGSLIEDKFVVLPTLTSDDQFTFDGNATTLTNKTIHPDQNTISHSTTNAVGDLLKGNGTQFITFPSSNIAGQVLQVQSGGDLAWVTPASGSWSASATETLTNKTISSDLNILKDSTTNVLGDLLVNNGTKFVRRAKGTANQVLAVNSGATDIAYTTIGDASIATHTSTKITINTKPQLLSSIVYNDQANTYGGTVDQKFPSTRLKLLNPAATFNYILTTSAITADRTVTLPLLTGNDQVTFDAFATSLTNKTIDTTLNTLTDASTAIGDIMKSDGTKYVRLGKGTANQVLAVNSGGTDLAWISVAGTSFTTSSTDTLTNKTMSGSSNTFTNLPKSALPAATVFTDQTNTFGLFDQLFKTSRLKIQNPAATFNYILASSAITADRTVTLPLLTGNDQVTMDAFATTLTNKTVNIDQNTIKHSSTNTLGGLLKSDGTKFSRFGLGSANQVLSVNPGGTDLIWVTPSGAAGFTAISTDTLQNKTIDGLQNSLNNIQANSIPPEVVYNDEANVYEVNDQVFPSSTIVIRNPAQTFAYRIATSAITADRTVTFPLLTGNDQITTDAATTTLTNKTINATDNIITDVTPFTGDILKSDGTRYVSIHRGDPGQVLTSGFTDVSWVTPPSGGWSATAVETLTNKAISVTDNTISDASIALGDILKSDGAKFVILPKGTAGQVLTAGTTDVSWVTPASGAWSPSATETLTNKTISGASNTLTNIGKSSIPATTVYTDQSNTFGLFDQLFKTSRLKLQNPAATFNYILATSAITADRTVTLPLLTGNDQVTFDAFATTLTNKTVNASNNTINDTSIATGDILKSNGTKFVRFARGTANQVLSVNSGGTDLTWVTSNLSFTASSTDTLTNKSISGSTNTLTNIPAAALPSNVDYIDQASTISGVDTYLQGSLVLRNPANTFSTTLNGGAVTSAMTLTLPAVTGNDTVTTDAVTTTLTNKTINASNNTINDTSIATGDILKSNGTKFVRLARGTSGQVLTAGSSDVSWITPASGGWSASATETLTNKTIDATTNILRNSGYEKYRIYRDATDGLYKCLNTLTGTIDSSSSTTEVPFQYALDHGNRNSIYVEKGIYIFSGGFTGLNFSQVETSLIMDAGAEMTVPNGYSGNLFILTETGSQCKLIGGRFTEDGATPLRLWTCYFLHGNTDGVNCPMIANSYVRFAGKCVRLFCDASTGWINGAIFQNMFCDQFIQGIVFDVTVAVNGFAGTNRNNFSNVVLQCETFSTYGVRDIWGYSNFFNDVKVWDCPVSGTSANITSNASDTIILAGIMTNNNYVDNGLRTNVIEYNKRQLDSVQLTGSTSIAQMAKPSSPSSGTRIVYVDSTSHDVSSLHSDGTVSCLEGMEFPSTKKWGTFTGASSASGNGLFCGDFSVAGTANGATIDSTDGSGASFSTSGTSGGSAGLKYANTYTMRSFNPRMKVKWKCGTSTHNRLYIGFTTSPGTDLTGDDPLNAKTGFILCQRSTDTNYQIAYNNGSGATTFTQYLRDGVNPLTIDTSSHTVEILGNSAASSWSIQIDGNAVHTISSGAIPASTTALGFQGEIQQSATETAHTLTINYMESESEK